MSAGTAALIRDAWRIGGFQAGVVLRIIIYLRVSTPDQAKRDSPETQLEEAYALLRARGIDPDDPTRCHITVVLDTHTSVVDDLEDRGVLKREVRTPIRDGRVDLLLVHDPDRHARSGNDLVTLVAEAVRFGCYVAYNTQPDLVELGEDGKLTPSCELLLFARGWAGKIEVQQFKERTKRNKARKVEHGYRLGTGRDAFGLRRVYGWRVGHGGRQVSIDVEPDPATWHVVLRMFDELLAGRTPAEIGAALEREGHRTTGTRGRRRWDRSAVHRVLANVTYTGWAPVGRSVRSRRWIEGDGTLVPLGMARRALADGTPDPTPREPIEWLPRWKYDRAQALLTGRVTAPRAGRGGADPRYLLRGRLTCAACGSTLQTEVVDGTRYYGCPLFSDGRARRKGRETCPARLPRLHAEAAEWQAWLAAEDVLADEARFLAALEALAGGDGEARRRLEAELGDVRRERAAVNADYAATRRLMTRAEADGNARLAGGYAADLAGHEQRLDYLDGRVARLEADLVAASGALERAADLAAWRRDVWEGMQLVKARAAAGEAEWVGWIVERLDVRGEVGADVEGAARLPFPVVKNGRGQRKETQRAFRLGWTWLGGRAQRGGDLGAACRDWSNAARSTLVVAQPLALRVLPTAAGYALAAAG